MNAPIEASGQPDPKRRALIEQAQAPLVAVLGDFASALALIAEAVTWWRAGDITTEQAMEAVAATVDAYNQNQEASE